MTKINNFKLSNAEYKNMANAIRALSMDAVEHAKSGHPGMPMGMADVATVLFAEFLKFNPLDAKWIGRDRFVLSAGHGSMLLYSLLYLTGYKDINIEDIKNFRQIGAKTAGHPEFGHLEGIETTTGPLGQGLANAVGMALAEKLAQEKFGSKLINNYTYTIVGDGCLMEGISQEAITFAAHMNLNKLIVLFDDNGISIDGPVSLATSEDNAKRFIAAGWNVISIDGHNYDQIKDAIEKAKNSDKPTMIACKTVIAYGSPNKGGSETSHGSPLGAEEIKLTKERLGWSYPAFEIPEEILNLWREAGKKSENLYKQWIEDFSNSDKKEELTNSLNLTLPSNFSDIIAKAKQEASQKGLEATRKSSGVILKYLTESMDYLIGGSADLTGSNDTKTSFTQPISRNNFKGSYIHYGIREHAMGAMMNGMALYGGFIPYGGTFLVFADYMKPAIRLSALMGLKVIYVMTHDSIGLGEDGPTHQPIEHLVSMRSIPNLQVFRPCDATETIESWEIALTSNNKPSLISLTRQNVKQLRTKFVEENLTRKGGYIISEAEKELKVTIFATGSEVQIALDAKSILENQGIGTRVVSMVSTTLFDQQPQEYQDSLIKNQSVKVAIEAASPIGWHKYIGFDGIFIGMEGFGASGRAEDLYKHFGITAEKTVENILKTISSKG